MVAKDFEINLDLFTILYMEWLSYAVMNIHVKYGDGMANREDPGQAAHFRVV